MNLKKRLKLLYYKIKPDTSKFVEAAICGKLLKVLPGTVRDKEDQDDAWWFYLAKHHDIVFDIGCNIGYTALLALIQNPNRRIILVDPNPVALQKASMNIIQNNMGSKAQYMPAFVGESTGDTVKFYTVGAGAAGSMYASHAQTAASINSFMQVNTVTLDDLYTHYNIEPDLIKIDVEGAETQVMQSAKIVASKSQCTFFIEMHKVENLGMEAAGQLIIEWCKEMKYNAWYLKTGEVLSSAEIIRDRGKCHLLLLPQEKQYPEYLKGIAPNASLPKLL